LGSLTAVVDAPFVVAIPKTLSCDRPNGLPTTRIIIVGAGGQGTIAADIAHALHDAGVPVLLVGFVDDDTALRGSLKLNAPVLGPISELHSFPHDAVVVAIGDNERRRLVSERLTARGEVLAAVIHPTASVSPTAQIGQGSMLSAGAIVLPNAVLGKGVILNTKASVDHDTTVGDFAHVSAGATVGARAQIGEGVLIALGASVISGVSVGAHSIVGAGATVLNDLPPAVRAWGVPARVVDSAHSG
jgi:sugar O-acyltransferase (sialic acid O-acetyltransferase NeuD family)